MFRNPVAIHRGPTAPLLASLIQEGPYVLVTSRGWIGRGAVELVENACGRPVAIFDGVTENPTLQQLAALEPALVGLRAVPALVVALGGGSVIDTAKAIAAALSPGSTMLLVEGTARAGAALPPEAVPRPLYCVPTTAGAGSEVTSTATLWDGVTGEKFSLDDPRLFPRAAVLDESLLGSAPSELILATGLDALSHAMESMWSRRHNPFSDACATAAIQGIRRNLPRAARELDPKSAVELQAAAALAGIAISATRTGLAHSISYPLTGLFGLRHGLACSFTLPGVAAFMLAGEPDRARIMADAFGASSAASFPTELREWLDKLGVYDAVRSVVDLSRVSEVSKKLLAKGRGDNSLRSATAADAEAILRGALADRKSPGVAGSSETSSAREVVR